MADRQVSALDPDIVAMVGAYVSGINGAAATGPRSHELVLLRAGRSPWTVADVFALGGLQSVTLAGNWDAEVGRLAILESDGPDALLALHRPYADWLPATMPPGSLAGPSLDRLTGDLDALRDLVGGAGASNAWALASSRTSTGGPILANDPHLAPDVPPPWYLAHLRTPDWEVAGASFVGSPTFPSGHNGHAAWGITAACTDSADLFWEELSLEDDAARGPHGPEPLTRISEEIAVRGGEPEVLEVIVTARGPVVTPVLDATGTALSLAATWLEPAPVRGLLDVVRARDFETFRRAFAEWPGPQLNVAYADREGHIGWQLVGTLPRRRAGAGMVPTPAWNGGWDEHLPFDAMPHLLDPDGGFVATANNAPRTEDPDAAYLGSDWLDGYRAAAIVEQLEARADWSVESAAALQCDVASLPWREIRETVLAAGGEGHGPERLALELLRTWDGVVGADSAAASVFELLVAELAASMAREAAPNGWRWSLGGGIGDAVGGTSLGTRSVSRVVAALRDGSDRSETIRGALSSAVRALVARHGTDPARWAWGDVRPLTLRHALGVAAPLDRVLNLGPLRVGGDGNTVAQAGVRPLDPLRNPGAIANHRMVIDLADVERSRFVLAGGQSGNPISPHYRDLLALWLRGEGVPIPWSAAAVEEATVERLVLRPS